MTVFDSESTIFFEQLLFYSALEQIGFLDDALLQDTKISFTPNADMTRQTSVTIFIDRKYELVLATWVTARSASTRKRNAVSTHFLAV
jgi:hypothetical protein